MASRTSRKEWVRGLPSAFGVGRYDRKRVHSASERSVGYVFLIEESVQNHPHPYQTGSQRILSTTYARTTTEISGDKSEARGYRGGQQIQLRLWIPDRADAG